MVQISKKHLDNYTVEKLSSLMFKLFKNKSKKVFDILTQSIFSDTERVMLMKRIAVLFLLLKNIEHYKIRKLLGVTESTINKYALIVEKNPNLYEKFNKLIIKEKITILFQEILNTLYGPGTQGISWSAARERQRALKKKKEMGL